MFDSIISEATERFNLGGKTGGVLSALLQLITNPATGGFGGFIDKFRQAGLGDAVNSWIGTDNNLQVSNFQMENALGAETIRAIGDQAGVDQDTAASVLGFMVPSVVDKLTPEGRVPDESSLRDKLSGIMGSLGKFGGNLGSAVGRAGSAAASGIGSAVGGAGSAAAGGIGSAVGGVGSAVGGVGSAVGNVGSSAASVIKRNSKPSSGGLGGILKWALPLFLLVFLVGAGYSCLNKGGSNTDAATAYVPTSGPAENSAVPAQNVESSLRIEAKDGKYAVTGVVPDQAALDKIKAALTAQYGEGNVDVSGLKIDRTAKPFTAGWSDSFAKMLPTLKDWKNGAIAFSGNAITTAEGLPQAALAQLGSLFTGWTLPVSVAGEENAAKQANEEALKTLANATSIDQIVGALNVSIINFRSGSAQIPADARPILEKAAEVLKKQPEGTIVEIGGYTDNQGNPEANKKLSQSRADAVKGALVGFGVNGGMLKAVGYGDADPVGDNNTEEGRFKNRRIEYKNTDGSAPTAATN